MESAACAVSSGGGGRRRTTPTTTAAAALATVQSRPDRDDFVVGRTGEFPTLDFARTF